MAKQDLMRQVFRFALVGGTVTACFMGLNWLFGRGLGRQAAFLLAYPPSVGLHFCLNKWWTFGCRSRDTGRQLGEYLVMVAIAFGIQWVVFTGLSAATALPSWADAGAANVAQMGLTFFVMQRRIFGARARSAASVVS
jgi:putative flippase GtrA